MSPGNRREPGERYFAALERSRRDKERAADEAERRYAKDVGVVRVISLVPPLLFCAAMIAGAASDDVAMFVLRNVLGPAGAGATAAVIGLILKYEGSPQRDFGVRVVVFASALLNGLTGFATGSIVYVLIPLAAPLTQWALPKFRTRTKAHRD
ncbi:hypothetical protein AB0B50_44540 [Streptomyces sp. NPDC041068]|uniref:hypothetical protein n=1 Tax=Streptomyces sp. NPDC041068 TaxID=3155130 RepID=UPI0033D1A62C